MKFGKKPGDATSAVSLLLVFMDWNDLKDTSLNKALSKRSKNHSDKSIKRFQNDESVSVTVALKAAVTRINIDHTWFSILKV
jgi:hypothetical protein